MNETCHHNRFEVGRWNSARMRLDSVPDFLQHLEVAHEDPLSPPRKVTCGDTAKVVPINPQDGTAELWAAVIFKPDY